MIRFFEHGAQDMNFRHARLSLPAFFVEDMHCIAQIHANWRFVIYDDEEDKPRFLVRFTGQSAGL